MAHNSEMRLSGTPHRSSSASNGGSTVRLGMGRVRSGNTTATRPVRLHPVSRSSSCSGGPDDGDRSAALTAPASSASARASTGSTTSAVSGTSAAAP